MDTAFWYEVVGYVGSALIVLSLAMTSLLRLRVINLVGALIFAVYGVLITAPPVWLVNGVIVLINVWQIRRMLGRTEDLEVLEVAPDSHYLRRFLAFHADDIARFVPEFDVPRADHRAFFVLRDLVPAAVVLARHGQAGEVVVDLDYAIPAYRDFTSGAFVYGGDLFADLEADRVVTVASTADHRRYLRRMGFTPADGTWRFDVDRATAES